MQKKILLTGLLALGIFSLASCGNEANNETTPGISTTPSTNTPTDNGGSTSTTIKPSIALEPYYNGLDVSKNGKEFIDRLSLIINKNVNKRSYDQVYDDLTITDADPNNPNNVICFYTGVSYPKGHNGNDRKWNREHTWAKAHGFNNKKYDAYSDLQHLRATEMTINNSRGNLDFDEVLNHGGKTGSDTYGNKWNKECFEPRDEVKGDVARIMFYMTVKYSSGDLKLKLVDSVPTSTSTGTGSFGSLKTLLKWHKEDPVDDSEKARHERIYNIQKNRNPFIDHPEFVSNVFGVKNDDNGNENVNQAKVNNVKSLIEALPSEITASNKDAVNAAKAAYDALNSSEKALVTNKAKLDEALLKLEALENPEVPSGVVGLTLDFNNIAGLVSGAYSANGEFALDGKNMTASAYWYNPSDFRLGTNGKKVKAEALDKFAIEALNGTKGSYLEFGFATNNLMSISIEARSVSGGTNVIILFKEEGSSVYESIYSKSYTTTDESGKPIQASLNGKKNGRFVIIAGGEKGRIFIDKIKFGVSA